MIPLWTQWYDSLKAISTNEVTVGDIFLFFLWSLLFVMAIGVLMALIHLIFTCLFSTRNLIMDPMMNNHDQVTVINNIPTSEFKNKEKGQPIEKIDDNTVIDIEIANESDK